MAHMFTQQQQQQKYIYSPRCFFSIPYVPTFRMKEKKKNEYKMMDDYD